MKIDRFILMLFVVFAIHIQGINQVSESKYQLNFRIGGSVKKPNSLFNSNYGGNLDAEIKYLFNKKLSTGFRLEQTVIQNENAYQQKGFLSGIVGNNFSFYATSDYLLSNTDNPSKILIGAGIGLNSIKHWESLGLYNQKISNETKPGLLIRSQLMYKYFLIGAEYNFIQNSQVKNTTISNKYLSLKVGISINLKEKQTNISATPQILKHLKFEDSTQQAKIFIFRESDFLHSFLRLPISINDTTLKVVNGSYREILVKADVNTLIHIPKTKESVTIKAEAGKTYYIKYVIRKGFFKNKLKIEIVDQINAEKQIKQLSAHTNL